MGAKILLIYPTPFRVTGLPIGLATLSAVLKQSGHQVKIFDTAFYAGNDKVSQTGVRSERMVSKKVNNEEIVLPIKASDVKQDLYDVIKSYQPDIIGFSILEIMYKFVLQITRGLKKEFPEILIIAGGVFPTFSPEIVINEKSIDMICLGEGETALVELCDRIVSKKSFFNIKGLWVKSEEKIIKNNIAPLHDLNKLPFQDFTEFNEKLFYKPMQGKMYKMVNIETSRGCCFNCTYCGAPRLRNFFKENDNGRYFRVMDMNKVISQIKFQIKQHRPDFLYFSSESFLSMNEKDFDIFVRDYDKIKMPFWIQTRIETITEKRLVQLKQIGMHWMSIGLEHGNEDFRKRILKRNYSNQLFFEKMDILRKLDIGASLNNIIGFPGETRELIFDTIKMNRWLWQANNKLEINLFLLMPYKGCELYELCKIRGLLKDNISISSSTLSGETILDFPEEFKQTLRGLIRTFNLYVKLPETYYNKIRIAESCDTTLRELQLMTAGVTVESTK
jgi:radical SAM superfamily enzyme YgiQ (UPF0313 family)